MLNRQKIVLDLLARINRPVTAAKLSKLVFLLRHEMAKQDVTSFFDFVPSQIGPHSYVLSRELQLLSKAGYIDFKDEGAIVQSVFDESRNMSSRLTATADSAIASVTNRYGSWAEADLTEVVSEHHSWYLSSIRPDARIGQTGRSWATAAIYTTGYEGESVDAFFKKLLLHGIAHLIDVRANPVSRKYGFFKSRLKMISEQLGLAYTHLPSLGISSSARSDLDTQGARTRLLREYEQSMLPLKSAELGQLAGRMKKMPCALMCMERQPQDCHRSKLAIAIAARTGLEVVHL